jgi:hypothetical protein
MVMFMYSRSLIVLSLLFFVGCAVQKDWVPTDGSRADATVRMSYEHNELEIPQASDGQALSLAIERCQIWGFEGAEAFGGITRSCSLPDGSGGCSQWLVTKEFQCTGSNYK